MPRELPEGVEAVCVHQYHPCTITVPHFCGVTCNGDRHTTTEMVPVSDLPSFEAAVEERVREDRRELAEDAYCVEEFLRKVKGWEGCAEDELTEAIEAAEKLSAAFDSYTEQGGGEEGDRMYAISYCDGPLSQGGFARDLAPLVLANGTYSFSCWGDDGDAEFEWEPTEYPITAEKLRETEETRP